MLEDRYVSHVPSAYSIIEAHWRTMQRVEAFRGDDREEVKWVQKELKMVIRERRRAFKIKIKNKPWEV